MRFAASPSIAYQQQRTSPTATGHLAADVIVAFDQWKDVKCFVSLINFMSTFSASIFLSSHITHAVHNNQMTYCLSLSLFHCTRVLRGGDLKRFWIPSCGRRRRTLVLAIIVPSCCCWMPPPSASHLLPCHWAACWKRQRERERGE